MRFRINLLANFGAALAGTVVTLIITPVLVEHLGVTAYALVPLVAQVMLYVTLPTVAINSMTSRYVMSEFAGGRLEAARGFLSTSYVSNVMAIILIIPVLLFVALDAEGVFDLHSAHIDGFRWLILWGAVGLIGALVSTVFSVRLFVASAFAEQAFSGTVGLLGRAGLILALFSIFEPSLPLVGVATACGSWVTAGLVLVLGRRVAPELSVSASRFRTDFLWRLTKSGSWALLSQISFLLLSGGSLLIASALLGAEEAAPYALALAIPNLVSGIIAAISNVFVPRLIAHNVREDKTALVAELLRGNRIIGLPVCAILAGVFAFGDQFYFLWVPKADADLLQILTIIILVPMAVFASNGCLFSMYTVLDQLRVSAVVTLAAGLISLCSAVLLVGFDVFDTPVIAVPFATSALMTLVNGIYHPLTVSRLMGVSRFLFIVEGFKMFVWLLTFSGIGLLCREGLGGVQGWSGFILTGSTFVLVGAAVVVGVSMMKKPISTLIVR